jgi:formylglycine-generating enzyme required for sulfatase activity
MKIALFFASSVLSFLFTASASAGQDWHFEYSGGVPNKLVWQTESGNSYDLWHSKDLGGWSHVEGFPQVGSGEPMEYAFGAEARGFFKIVSETSAFGGMVTIPAGSFQMGDQSDDPKVGDDDEVPVHGVAVSTFFMGKYEVSKARWDEVRAWGVSHGYTDLPTGGGKAANHPVQNIKWYEMVKWCNARSEMEGLAPCYHTDDAHTTVYRTGNVHLTNAMVDWSAAGYRLPTEAEWEKAARGGLVGMLFPWGETINHDKANFYNIGGESYASGSTGYHPAYDNPPVPYTSPVGSFAPNGYGLYDMSGNVREWCWDQYGEDYYDTDDALGPDPKGPQTHSNNRVIRGGSYSDPAAVDRCANRAQASLNGAYYDIGFRVVRALTPEFMLIPGGDFVMGNQSPEGMGGGDQFPVHTVNVSTFYMQNTEVTKAQWDEVRAWGLENGYTDLPTGGGKAANHPVQNITWYAMVKWCNAKSEMEGRGAVYAWLSGTLPNIELHTYRTGERSSLLWSTSASGYRLPTEAEWEKAARGGLVGERFPWGAMINHDKANFNNDGGESYANGSTGYHPAYDDDPLPYTSPVGSFAPNGYGLYDMSGNVQERCWDLYDGDYYGTDDALGPDPTGPSYTGETTRVFRGGNFDNFAYQCSVAFRTGAPANGKSLRIGFRPVCGSAP